VRITVLSWRSVFVSLVSFMSSEEEEEEEEEEKHV
jgi:hypothetical protein